MEHVLHLHVASLTDVGCIRAHNEDSMVSIIPQDPHVLATKGALFVIADGLGGHEKGDVASTIAVEAISMAYYQQPPHDVAFSLLQAIKYANSSIFQRSMEASDTPKRGMGTTCIAAVLYRNTAFIANVGDSRAYLIRDGASRQISSDHSWVAEQVLVGSLTAEEARLHPQRHVITRCLGAHADVDVDIFTVPVQADDTLVLCSDGLSSLVEDDELCDIVAHDEPAVSVSQLISRAKERGGHDNITAIVARIT